MLSWIWTSRGRPLRRAAGWFMPVILLLSVAACIGPDGEVSTNAGGEADDSAAAARSDRVRSETDTADRELCQKYGVPSAELWGSVSGVAGVSRAPASRVVTWQQESVEAQRSDPQVAVPAVDSPWSGRDPQLSVVVCFLDGVFGTPQPVVPGGPIPEPHDRFVVVVADDGETIPFVASTAEKYPVQDV